MTNGGEFWLSSGFHLLDRRADGKLPVTDDFLRAYFRRPEMRPIEESCAAERDLHAALLADPRSAVPDARLDSLADGDARENYRHVLAFRDRLVAHPTIEDCYLAQFTGDDIAVPPLFIDQMIHVILRNILADCRDPVRLRAAEILFRSQTANPQDGAILLADEEVVDMHAATGGMGGLGQLLIDNLTPTRQVELDVIDDANGATYWQRSDQFDTVIDLSAGRPVYLALAMGGGKIVKMKPQNLLFNLPLAAAA